MASPCPSTRPSSPCIRYWPANAKAGATVLSNRVAVVKVQGVDVALTERRTPFHTLTDFAKLDLKSRPIQNSRGEDGLSGAGSGGAGDPCFAGA